MKTPTWMLTAAFALTGLTLAVPGVAAHDDCYTLLVPDGCGNCQAPHSGDHYIGFKDLLGLGPVGVPYCSSFALPAVLCEVLGDCDDD
jgi:hypothetical protein